MLDELKMTCGHGVNRNEKSGAAAANASRYRAPALDKGLDIIELLAASPVGLTQSELAKNLGRSTNEIYRMLDTLVRRGYIVRNAAGDRHSLSLRLLMLAGMQSTHRRLIDAAEPPMLEFTRQAEQSVHIAILEQGTVVIGNSVEAAGNWRMSLRAGSLVGLSNTGSGLVLAAFQPADIRSRIIEEHVLVPGEAPFASEELEVQLDEVVAKGFVCQESRAAHGVMNISSPILNPAGHAIAALTCPYLQRIDGHSAPGLDKCIALVCKTASEIADRTFGM